MELGCCLVKRLSSENTIGEPNLRKVLTPVDIRYQDASPTGITVIMAVIRIDEEGADCFPATYALHAFPIRPCVTVFRW